MPEQYSFLAKGLQILNTSVKTFHMIILRTRWELNLWFLSHIEKKDSCVSLKNTRGQCYILFLVLILGDSELTAAPPCASCLQDFINNTALAELEKRLKETPFNPPEVGKNINDPRKLHTLNNYGCLLQKKGKTVLETTYVVHL